ncbi:MAG: cell division protein FtsA [Candidatus Muiribacteriota bacterium]
MSRNYTVTGIDVGTNKIVVLIGEITEDELKVIGIGKVNVNVINKEGAITNIDELKNKLDLAVEEAEKMADVQVDSVYINLFGTNLKCFSTNGTISVHDKNAGISRNDLVRVLETVKNTIVLPENHEIIHILARNFTVDEMTGIKDPVGMRGSSLESDVYVVSAPESVINNIEKCVESAGFEIKDFVYEPLASAEAVLTDDEKKMGAVVTDIGGTYTTMSVYKDGSIVTSDVIPIGSNSITNDIAIILRTSFDEAEKLKIYEGSLYNLENNDKVELFNTSKENVKMVTKKYLNEIIFARYEEIFKHVFNKCEREGLTDNMKSGIILTGGGSQLEGLPVFVEHLFDLPVRFGRPLSLKGLFDKINSPVYSNAVGILKYAQKSHNNSVSIEKNPVKKVVNKIKDYFETYF